MDSTATRTAVLNTALLKAKLAAIKSSTSDHENEEGDVIVCVVCLEKVTEKAQAQPCLHSQFDFICLASWLQERSSCPLCNTEVLTIHYGFNDKGEHKEYAVKSTSRSTSESPSQPSLRPRTPIRHSRCRRQYVHRSVTERDELIERRRRIYRENLYSLHIGSNRTSGYRDFTPRSFAQDTELQSRARKWIRRELRVFEYLYPTSSTSTSTSVSPSAPTPPKLDRRANNAEFLLEYIIAILKTVDAQGSTGQAIEMLKEFLGREHATLFLHELRAWLRSPYAKVEEWDREVQYAEFGKRTAAAYTEAARPGERGDEKLMGGRGRARLMRERYSPYGNCVEVRDREAPD